MREGGIRVLGRVVALPDTVQALRSLLESLVEPTRRRDGCIRYDLTQNLADPTEFMFIQEWESESQLVAHLTSDALQAAVRALDGLVASPPDIRKYRVLA